MRVQKQQYNSQQLLQFYNILRLYIGMGQIITQFAHERKNIPEISFFTDKSLSKIQQFYEIYKCCSDTFAIDDTVFKDIFGELHPVFQILDSNSSLLIDGLQLFAALPLFSKLIKLQDKIQFIFKIFDFNGLRSLSITDTQFMVLTCCSVTHKLLGIKSYLRDDIIMSFVHEQFQTYNRVNISQFKKWGITSNIVGKFINLIYNQEQQIFRNSQSEQRAIKSLLSQKLYRSYITCSRNDLGSLFSENSRLMSSRQILQKQTSIWFKSNKNLIDYDASSTNQNLNPNINANKITLNKKGQKVTDPSDFTLVPNWVYGIRYKDVKYFISYIDQNQVIYFVGKVVVLYNLRSEKQRQYLHHDKPVICLAVNKSQLMVATSQLTTVDKINQQAPAIRIWNPINLQTIAILKGHHKIGVHLMNFSNSGQLLITCGLIFYSPIVIFSVKQNFKPIYSVSCLHPTVQISTLYGIIDKKSEDFVIVTLYGVKYFQVTQTKNKINIDFIDLNNLVSDKNQQNSQGYQYGSFSPITCCSFIHTNYYEKYLSSYDNSLQKLIITGHEKGQVFVWSTAQKTILFELNVQSCQITNIIPSASHILICSNSSLLNFWDIDLKQNKKLFQIDITTLDMELQGHQICGVVQKPYSSDNQLSNDYGNFQYIVATSKGDFFIFNLRQKQDHSLRYKLIGPRFESKKINKLIYIEAIASQKLLQRQEQQNLLIFGGPNGYLYIVSTVSHEILQTWKIGESIIAIDAIEIKQNIEIVVATSHKRVYSSSNFIEKNQKYEMEKSIKCIKLIIDNGHLLMILGLEGGQLHFINTVENEDKKKNIRNLSQANSMSRKLLSVQPKTDSVNENSNKILASNYAVGSVNTNPNNNSNGKQNSLMRKIKLASTPTQIVSLQKKMLLISTEDNIFYIISMKDFHFKAIQPQINPLSFQAIKNKCIKSYYCLTQLKKGVSRSSKKVYKLPIILGKYEKLVIAANADSSINLWKNLSDCAELNKLKYNWHASRCVNFAIDLQLTSFYSSGSKDGMIVQSLILRFFQSTRTVLDPFRALVSADSMLSLINYQQSGQNNEVDSLIKKQIQFCTFNNEITAQKYDQHIQIRGLQNQTLCRMFEGMSQQWKIINKLTTTKSAPKISLKLDYVYGLQTDNKRSTVLAINSPQTYFVYFISNLIIVYDPRSNGQKIYKGHRYKITCINKIFMSDKIMDNCADVGELIVSGESSYRPVIKIWNPHTLQTLRTIQTIHTDGIINIFCTSSLILSFGVTIRKLNQNEKEKQKQRYFSLEISSVLSGNYIASRHIKQYILSMAISPLNSNYFVTTGQYNVTIWKVISGNIQKYSVIQTNSTVTCCLYRLVEQSNPSYDIQEPKQNDDSTYTEQIIVGSENGQLGIICNQSKYLIIEQKAHQKAINCISYINQLNKEEKEKKKQNQELQTYKNINIKYIVTCSQDQTLKIWNKKFQISFQQDIRQMEFQEKVVASVNSAALNNNFSNNRKTSNLNTGSSKNKSLFKNVSVQSLSPIYDIHNPHQQLSLLIATRNGEVLVLKESDSNKGDNRKKGQPEIKYSSDQKDQSLDQAEQLVGKVQSKRPSSRRNSMKSAEKGEKQKTHKKSINLNNGNKAKLRIPRVSGSNLSNTFSQLKFLEHIENDKNQEEKRQKPIESMRFILYLRSHSSQICTSTRAQFINNKEHGGKVLFSHHPKLQLIATVAEDQNLFFWDTQRNVAIFHIVLGYIAEPTVLKFTKDGDILIVGYSDGFVMFLDSQISKSHQGKGGQKFILPTLGPVMQIRNDCPVLAIEQSESGDYLAISFNNKISKSTRKSSHILIYFNKSRERTRNHANTKMQSNDLFEMVTKIPCQSDSVFVTSNNNEYGMAAHTMMFTENEGKTYLLIYEQLIDIKTHKSLNLDKDGNYIIWDVNTSTMIANTDQVSNLIWKRICIPNSIYARYLLYPHLTKNQECSNMEKPNSNTNLSKPYFTSMINLPSHIFLGSLNGDIHIAQTSCLEYGKMLTSIPREKQLFVGKTYPAHCSQVNHIQFNQQKSLFFTSGLTDRCILKWKIEGDFNIQLTNSDNNNQTSAEGTNLGNGHKINSIYLQIDQDNGEKVQNEEYNKKIDEQFDVFKQIPHFQQIEQMKNIYRFKQKFSWSSIPNNYNYIDGIEQIQKLKKNSFIKNLCDFIETIKVTNIIGRNAHNTRHNLWYDQNARIVYSSGHAIVVLKTKKSQKAKKENVQKNKTKQIENTKKLTNNNLALSDYVATISLNKQFIHITNGRGQQLFQQISCTCISEDRKLIYAGHNGTSASVSIWNVSTKLRLKVIILKQIIIILKIRSSYDNKSLIVYGINEQKKAYLMLICLQSSSVVGIVSFLHEKVGHIKDIAYYPKSNYRFVTCGINDTLSWKLQGNQLTYSILPCVAENSNNVAQNHNYGNNYAHKSISICIAFLPKSSRVITGCEDGNLLLWGENSFQRREHADVVMVLKTTHPNILLSGSRDGTILLWIEETIGGGLTLSSKLNLRMQSTSVFKAYGMNNYQKNNTQSDTLEQQEQNVQEMRIKKRKQLKKTMVQTNKQIQHNNSRYQNNKNNVNEAIYQEFCVQSIEVLEGQNQYEDEDKKKQGPLLLENMISALDKQNDGKIKSNEQSKTKHELAHNNQLQRQLYLRQNYNLRKWKLLVGTTSGNIYESTFSQQNRAKIVFDKNCQMLEVFHDHQVPKSFFFSKTDQQIYQITSKGYFTCRRIADSTIIFEQNFDRETVDLIYSPKNNLFFIIFKNEIRSYRTFQSTNQKENNQEMKTLATKQIKFITHAEISGHQKVLAVGVTKNSDKTVNIQVYDVSKIDQMKFLLSFAMPPGQSIQFIDFSTNNKIVLIKLVSTQKIKIIAQELTTLQNIQQDLIPFTEWNNKAQNLYDRNKKIIEKIEQIITNKNQTPSTNQGKMEQNQFSIIRISQIYDNIFVLVDNQGNVYSFNSDIKLIGESRIKISQPSIIKFSHSKKLLGIGSQVDRNIVVFDIGLTHVLKGL